MTAALLALGRKSIHNARPSRREKRGVTRTQKLSHTKYHFAIFGFPGSRSISLRAAKIVAANRMANFLSSVTRNSGIVE